MAAANTVELETCIADCLAFCAANPDLDFVEVHAPRLQRAHDGYVEAMATSDARFTEWRGERRDEMLAWKKVAGGLREAQRTLRRSNVIGFPETKILYWDREKLVDALNALRTFLVERRNAIPTADKIIEDLDRRLSTARGEARDDDRAFGEYVRYASKRASAMGTLSSALSDFRASMRRHFGKRDERYRAIRWPMALNPDFSVL